MGSGVCQRSLSALPSLHCSSSVQYRCKLFVVVLQELKYDAAKTRALRDRHRPSIEAMLQAANAMVLLACDPEAQTQHPSIDLSAAAAAAVRNAVNGSANAGSSAGSSADSRQVVSELTALPPLGSVPDDTMLTMIRRTPISALRTWLESFSRCQYPRRVHQ